MCDGLFRALDKVHMNPRSWRMMVKEVESFMKTYPKNIILKKIYAEALRKFKSTDFTKPPKRKQKFIIADKEEYNKRPSVGFSNLSPDVRFLFESGAIAFTPSAIEKASNCISSLTFSVAFKLYVS